MHPRRVVCTAISKAHIAHCCAHTCFGACWTSWHIPQQSFNARALPVAAVLVCRCNLFCGYCLSCSCTLFCQCKLLATFIAQTTCKIECHLADSLVYMHCTDADVCKLSSLDARGQALHHRHPERRVHAVEWHSVQLRDHHPGHCSFATTLNFEKV